MKPLAVLLLVLVAIGGLFFAMNFLGGGSGTQQPQQALEQGLEPSGQAPANGGELTRLAGESGEATRVGQDAVAADQRSDTGTQPEGQFYNNTLSGQVKSVKGSAIANAEVTLTRAPAATRIFANERIDRSKDVKTTADEQGNYRFIGIEPYDYYMVEAVAPGFSRGEVADIQVQHTGDVVAPTILLAQGATLTGTVLDVAGNVVPGAQLVLTSQYTRPGMELPDDAMVTSSDGSGAFSFLNVPQGNRTLSCEADGYANMSFGGLVFQEGRIVERDVRLDIAEMISGRVIGKTGENVVGAQVLAMSFTQASRSCVDQAVTDDNGEFVLDSLAHGQYNISVQAVGYKTATEPRVKTGATNLVIQLAPQSTVSGFVLVNGGAPPNYKVRLRQTYENNPATSAVSEWQAYQNPDGAFLIDSVQPGSYVVEGLAAGHAPTYSTEFRVGQGMPVKGIIVNLRPGGALVGRVVDSSGKPVARPQVSTHDNTWADTVFDLALGDQFPTNATAKKITGQPDGTFRLDNLKGETYQVRVKAPGHCELILQDVRVVEGDDTNLGELRMLRGGTVTGQVFDTSGEALAGAKVTLASGFPRNSGLLPRTYSATTDDTGKFRVVGVYPGDYTLSALRGGRADDIFGGLAHAQDNQLRISVQDEQTVNHVIKL